MCTMCITWDNVYVPPIYIYIYKIRRTETFTHTYILFNDAGSSIKQNVCGRGVCFILRRGP